jgi:hypothetical protein
LHQHKTVQWNCVEVKSPTGSFDNEKFRVSKFILSKHFDGETTLIVRRLPRQIIAVSINQRAASDANANEKFAFSLFRYRDKFVSENPRHRILFH